MKLMAACLAKKTTRSAASLKERAVCNGRRAACTCKQKEERVAKRVRLKPASGKLDDQSAASGRFSLDGIG